MMKKLKNINLEHYQVCLVLIMILLIARGLANKL